MLNNKKNITTFLLLFLLIVFFLVFDKFFVENFYNENIKTKINFDENGMNVGFLEIQQKIKSLEENTDKDNYNISENSGLYDLKDIFSQRKEFDSSLVGKRNPFVN